MSEKGYILGLDLGVTSLGWAAIQLEQGKPTGILGTGVRIFEAGLADLERDGKGRSRNQDRRMARQQRRMLERRSRRKLKLFHLLQNAGLLPPDDADSGKDRNKLLNKLDDDIVRSRLGGVIAPEQQLPYILRALALDEKLEPFEIGRAIYHLAQRRGFLSNRRAGAKDDEEGAVKSGIAELRKTLEKSGYRSLGEYFNSLDPHEERIRQRWTSRQMYKDEFDLIWEAQVKHHSRLLTPELKAEVDLAIFKQRPLKSAKKLIGHCALEPDKRRAPIASLEFQRFRYLQRVNDLEVVEPTGVIRPLTEDERDKLIEAFEEKGDCTFKQIKKLLKLQDCSFNLEEGGEKKLPGNRSFEKVTKALGDQWDSLPPEERECAVEELISFNNEEALARRATKLWSLDEKTAATYSHIRLEEGYARYSRRALRKLNTYLEAGTRLNTAIKEEFGDQDESPEPLDRLQPVLDAIPELRNPVVSRSLTEMRKVVNAVVRKYGKPSRIHLEMVRDLKKNPKAREDAFKRNRMREKERKVVAARIAEEAGIADPSRRDIERVLLAEECNWTCPFTGKAISMSSLVGDAPQFEVEHIIPFSRSLDNTFLNKTLCHTDENLVKGKRTPREAYSGDEKHWEEIIGRVLRFRGGTAREKLRRFQLTDDEVEDLLDAFTERDLADTAYAARLAAEYLGGLYGGIIDSSGKRRVQVIGGQATAFFRNEWELNKILGDGPRKSRDDHRHHAVDAAVIAVTDAGMIRRLSTAAGRAQLEGRRLFGKVVEPWPGFFEDVSGSIRDLIVSHRVEHVLRGALHEETIYSPPRGEDGRRSDDGDYVHVRKNLKDLSRKDIERIVDPVVREAVTDTLGNSDPAKVFADQVNLPRLPNGTVVKKTRLRRKQNVTPIADGHKQRHVMTGANHHVEILETTDTKGKSRWLGEVVTLYEASQRRLRGEPVVKRDHGEGMRFVFSLAGGDCIQLPGYTDDPNLFRIRAISAEASGTVVIEFVDLREARKKVDIKAAGCWNKKTPHKLHELAVKKVLVSPTGNVTDCHD
ncbi:MAG: type II CRISPR RNA-guided endonuclease Cas9 [Candidatus Krumholzibacteriota bacterium]|nr:type II CRISPR RNA-guided endonuclease Cas9 [Candidatus Krumholzibacteriota bacterium]